MSFRGLCQFKAHQNPFRLLQLIVVDEHNKAMFKRPLWLSIFGEKRLAISLHECVENYRDRYVIEHYVRFGKQSLLRDLLKTYDTHHEESWWKLCAPSYYQIYLSRELCRGTPEAWERHLPEFKAQDKMELVSAPFAKRGFSKLLNVIGAPAQKPIQRGNSLGRKNGHKLTTRVVMPIKFKQGVAGAKKKKLFSTFEKEADKAKPKNIGISMEAFNQFVANPK